MSKGPLLIIPGKSAGDQHFLAPEDEPILNLEHRHFTHTVGQFTIIGTWILQGRVKDPCLVLFRADRPISRKGKRQVPCIVPMTTSWMWAEPPIGDEAQAIAMACDFCHHLELNPFRDKDVMAVLVAVRSRLEDLIRIPPAPKMDRIMVGEVTFKTHDGLEVQQEVKAHG